ncbi:hypothetical protein [Aquisphaera insulae]|uniref:hypothetical protein n=1 Tax=Aquisphaera insulae TaxID=2712864 RepID=UPI0013EA962D|nr:hypothetical protein [Aquisphaera insulae]
MIEGERPPRTWLRFRLQLLMVAVAALAAWLFAERELYRTAARMVSEIGDGEQYLADEANMVWAILSLAVFGPLALLIHIILKFRSAVPGRPKATTATDP